MDAIKQRLNALRLEIDESTAANEVLKAKIKTLEQDNLTKEQDVTSLSHRNQLLEETTAKLEAQIATLKGEADEGSRHGRNAESLQARINMLEEEAERSDKNLSEANDRLRQTDVKAGHFERKVQALEQERDQAEAKYEEMLAKYTKAKKELDDFAAELGNI